MESPDKLPVRLAPPECQGSPIYNFLCNLSPIKLAKSVRVVHTYTDLSFPPAVFLTPKADSRKELSSHEKNEETGKIQQVQSQTMPTISVQIEGAMTIQGLKKFRNTQGKVDSPVNSPSKIVEQYLSEPTDIEPSNEDMPTTSDRGHFRLHSNVLRPNERRVSFKDDINVAATEVSNQIFTGNFNEKLVLENNESDNDMSFLLSENSVKEECWQSQTSSALSELSIQQTTSSIPIMSNLLSQEPQQMEIDCLSAELKDDMLMSDPCDDKQIPPGSKVKSYFQRGIRRRCLDFEDDQRKGKKVSPSNKLSSESPQSILTDISDAPAHLRILRERALANSGAINSDNVHNGFEITPDKTTGDSQQQQTPASILTGFRLYHNEALLSSRSVQGSRDVCAVPFLDADNQCGEGNEDRLENHLCPKKSGDDYSFGSTPNFVRGTIHNVRGERKCQDDVFDPVNGMKKTDGLSASNSVEKRNNSIDHTRPATLEVTCQIVRSQEECDESPQSPKKRRKSVSASEKSGDGCKRCNCKKSKCLKLYCECFAAGVYCVDSCSCQGCHNKPNFEETVLETRQQIESRNPLAFAPKVVVTVSSDVSPGEHESKDTPASARHKRGCNCKRSKCLKKYCECYQSGVGCSDGCRCENCQNVYGRKEGQKDFEDKDVRSGIIDKEATEEESDMVDSCQNPSNASEQKHPDLSPITPSMQHMGQNRSSAISRTASSRRFSYEELQSPSFLLSSSKPLRTPSRLLRSSNDAESPIILFTDSQFSCSPMLTQETPIVGQFSPGWEGLADICSLTPLTQAQGNPAPSGLGSDGNIDNSPSFNVQQYNETQSNVGNDKSRLAQRSLSLGHHGKISTSDSLEGAPVTPQCVSSPMSSGRCPTTVLHKGNLESVDGDTTPEFFKGLGVGFSPLGIINSTSPKQKRISPSPHRNSRSIFDKGHPAPGFRNGRKIILQSVLPSE